MNTFSKFFFAIIALSIVSSSCTKPAVKIIENGTWVVSLYLEDNKDETSDFSGYTFDFNKDGKLAVTLPAGTVVNGTWSYDDNTSKYVIAVSGTDKLDKINEDWLIVSKSSTLIELKDDNSSKNEVLNFKKK